MFYQDIINFNLVGILPKKKRYGTDKDKSIVYNAIVNNKDFVQFALNKTGANYINQIIDKLIDFIIKCNQIYYFYEKN